MGNTGSTAGAKALERAAAAGDVESAREVRVFPEQGRALTVFGAINSVAVRGFAVPTCIYHAHWVKPSEVRNMGLVSGRLWF